MTEELKEILELAKQICTIELHLRVAARMAKINEPNGTIKLAILSQREDKTGHVSATFECEEFLNDLSSLAEKIDKLEDGDGKP